MSRGLVNAWVRHLARAGGMATVAAMLGCQHSAHPREHVQHPPVQTGRGQHVVLVDSTDPLTNGQVVALQERLELWEREDLRAGDLVSVWQLGTSSQGALRRLFRRAYPGRSANALFHNPQRVAQRCDTSFSLPLRQVIRDSARLHPATWSPILEACCEMAQLAELEGASGPRHLLLVSDLQQHTPTLSFSSHPPAFAAFKTGKQFAPLRADLSGVSVEVLYVSRAGDQLSSELQLWSFWKAYFTACGASQVRLQRL